MFGEDFFFKASFSSITVYIFIMGGLRGDQIPVLTLLFLLIKGPIYSKMRIQLLSTHLLVSHSSAEVFRMQVSPHTFFLALS